MNPYPARRDDSPPAATMSGSLNIFQRTMLEWNGQQPYNSVHAAQVFAPLDLARIAAVTNRALHSRGIARLVLDAERGTFEYRSDTATETEIKIIAGGEDPTAALATEVTRQLNTPFAHLQPFNPFRFFLVPGPGSFHLGLVFFHAVADGTSAAELLADIVDAYLGMPMTVPALDLYPKVHDAILFRDPILFVRKVVAMVASFFALRRARRVPGGPGADATTAVIFFSLSTAEMVALQHASKAWAVTLNDLFLALLLQSFSRQLSPLPPEARRTRLAVGCIVNLRGELNLLARTTFGLFLGSLVVVSKPLAEMTLRERAQAVRQQTARIKRQRLAVATALELRFARWVRGFYSPERQRKFYQKNYPLWGGISNVNLDALWPQPAGHARVEYFRAVSPGPVTPLVLSITSFGGGVNIGLAYRQAVFSANQVDQIKRDFQTGVRDLSLT